MFEGNRDIGMIRSQGPAIIVAVVTILCLVPFVKKAFHIDDPLFLWAAKHIQTDPADFYGFTVNWYGTDMPMSEVAKNPPGTCYYIAAAASLFGWSETALHTVFLIPAVAAALGTFYLAKRFCSHPAPAALAAVLTPAFLVSGTNVMCDVMMLAFWVWAVYLWVRGLDENKFQSLFFAAVLVAFCALTKYFGMALLPLLIAYSLMKKRKIGLWILFFLVPVVILAGYQWMTHNLYGRGLLTDAADYATKIRNLHNVQLLTKGLTGLFFTGGSIATVVFFSPILWARRILMCSIGLTILFIFALSSLGKIGTAPIHNDNGLRWSFLIQAGLMATGGVGILVLAGTDFFKFKNANSLLLLLWVFGIFIFAAFINWTVNVRSILPIAPAAGILLMRRADRNGNGINQLIKLWQTAWPLVPSAVLALFVCRADYTWANSARTAAADIQKKYENSGRTVWFEGHWGFQYYMQADGFRPLDYKNLKVAGNDIIIIPYNNTNIRTFPKDVVNLDQVFQLDVCRTISTSSQRLGAGFYADIWGPLPYVFGQVEPERYSAFTPR
jgi:4-amino-4-deoxy-L-arabinose transferase-like glycosyltransferase